MPIQKTDSYMAEMSMYISKATLDKGVMKWAAVNSDTAPDSYDEKMSLELYENFIENINSELPLPEQFKAGVCSDYWCGGMPYLSVSHYPDLNGQAVPGEPLELFVDGEKLKARGILFDSPLGHSVWRSLKEDKVKSSEEKIRISIGFLDLTHKHGDDGELFVRDGLMSLCPQCLEGVGDKVYVKGYLVHLALTRVPVNKRTEMVLEEKSEMATKKTRKEDAASIVGKDLAEEIEVKQKAVAQKSDALIEMSDAEPGVEEPVLEIDTTLTEKKSEISTPVVDEKSVDTSYAMNLPYGGATSMKDAAKAKETAEEMIHVMDMFSMFQNVAWNIIDRSDITDKKAAFAKAVDEFKSMLAAKAMLEFSVVQKSEEIEEHPLQPALDVLLDSIDNTLVLDADVNGKLLAINPALQELGTAITDFVTTKSAKANDEPPAPISNNDNLLEKLQNIIQPLSESVQALSEKVGILESRASAQSVEVKPRIPAPRTLTANIVNKAVAAQPKQGSLTSIIRKSVGLPE